MRPGWKRRRSSQRFASPSHNTSSLPEMEKRTTPTHSGTRWCRRPCTASCCRASASEFVYHLQASGAEALALEGWIHAGSAAEAIYAFAEAGARFERALVLWDGLPGETVRAGLD